MQSFVPISATFIGHKQSWYLAVRASCSLLAFLACFVDLAELVSLPTRTFSIRKKNNKSLILNAFGMSIS